MSAYVGRSFSKRLVGMLRLDLIIENVTGLLIQMPVSAQAYRIGGADKYPLVTKKKYVVGELEVPYIPGSSLKGRMRALLELAFGKKLYTTDGKIWSHVRSLTAMTFDEFRNDVESRDVIDELFGWAAVNYRQIEEAAKGSREVADRLFELLTPTRLLVDDFFPASKYIQDHNVKSVADFLEEKPENRIDRVTSAADPRDVVRVKPGVRFEGSIRVLFFNNDKDMIEGYVNTLISGLRLVEETYLGNSGSRGYGRVRVVGDRFIVFKVNPATSNLEVLMKVSEESFTSTEELLSKRDKIVGALRSLYQ